jgi:GNAT superfamily N-acetyltransferase
MIQYSKATIDELNEMIILFNAYRLFYKKTEDLEATRDFLSERLIKGDSTIYVAHNELNEGVGFTQLYPLFSSTRMKRLWLLNDLFVRTENRGQGISIALIDLAKKLATDTNACGLMLETAKTNDIGNNLYTAQGFELDTDFNVYNWNV